MIESQDHFTDEVWADFVRGLTSSETNAQIQSHLSSDCDQCKARQSLWTLVAQAAKRDAAPPQSAVRRVEDAFEPTQESPYPIQAAEAARLISKGSESLFAGVRGAAEPRHFLYEAADFLVNIGITLNEDQPLCLISGHITPKQGTVTSAGGAKIYLVGLNNRVVRHVVADAVGGFEVESDARDDFKVLLHLPIGTVIEVFIPKA